MKCFNHPQSDAVGICAQCNRAVCRQCVEDIGGILLCMNCLAVRRRQAELEDEATEFGRQADARRAQNRIRWSWIVGGLGLVFGIFPGIAQASEAMRKNDLGASSAIAAPSIVLLFVLVSGYLFWSMFWGVPVVWRWTRRFTGYFQLPSINAGLAVWVILLSCCISLPLTVAIYYSVFGGGIYQYLRCRRIALENV